MDPGNGLAQYLRFGATRTEAHHMINRQVVDIVTLIGAPDIFSAEDN